MGAATTGKYAILGHIFSPVTAVSLMARQRDVLEVMRSFHRAPVESL